MTPKNGRPRADLDLDHLKKLAAAGLSQEQTAVALQMSQKTLQRRLADTPGARDAWDTHRPAPLAPPAEVRRDPHANDDFDEDLAAHEAKRKPRGKRRRPPWVPANHVFFDIPIDQGIYAAIQSVARARSVGTTRLINEILAAYTPRQADALATVSASANEAGPYD